MILLSDCCGAEASDWYLDAGICPDCKDHCGFEDESDDE